MDELGKHFYDFGPFRVEKNMPLRKKMRKVTLGLANSLDNYIARKDGGYDWLHWSKEVAEISARFMKTVDTLMDRTQDF